MGNPSLSSPFSRITGESLGLGVDNAYYGWSRLDRAVIKRMGDSFVALTSKSQELAVIYVADPVVIFNSVPSP